MIRSETTDRVAVLTIDRQERRNALNLEALEALDAAMAAAIDDGVAAVIIRGEGGHFCAGADLKELEDLSFDTRLRGVLEHIANVPVPTFAAISGACMGLGMQLALACDIRVATPDAYFGIPAGKLGLVVNHWTLQRLAWCLGFGAARLMVLTADTLAEEDAWRLGFTQVRGDLDAAKELAARVCDLAPLSLAGTKVGLNLVERALDEPAFNEAFTRAWTSEDLAEGRLAFSERRSPVFKGR
ncbi:MAG: enoyl-CoA hydratase-related protein [Acidimicrobiales bacterium]